MLDQAFAALGTLLSGTHLLHLLIGVGVGIVVGILPGLGGIAGMALLLPFVFGMDQVSALGMMIGLLAVMATADTFTSVLMGIPGSAGSQATVMDGFPLARAGRARRLSLRHSLPRLSAALSGALPVRVRADRAAPGAAFRRSPNC